MQLRLNNLSIKVAPVGFRLHYEDGSDKRLPNKRIPKNQTPLSLHP